MSSKAEILARIRRQKLPEAPLPPLDGEWTRYADRERQFCEVLTSVGGQPLAIDDSSALEATVRGLPCMADAKLIVCCVDGLSLGNFDLNQIDDPHQLEPVDVAIMPGEFGVAENGAIWVSTKGVRHRAAYFLTQHLVLVVPRSQLVDHLYDAYQRLQFDQSSYGLFISGPSKTADIEQSLVIGAHGPRSMTAILVGA